MRRKTEDGRPLGSLSGRANVADGRKALHASTIWAPEVPAAPVSDRSGRTVRIRRLSPLPASENRAQVGRGGQRHHQRRTALSWTIASGTEPRAWFRRTARAGGSDALGENTHHTATAAGWQARRSPWQRVGDSKCVVVVDQGNPHPLALRANSHHGPALWLCSPMHQHMARHGSRAAKKTTRYVWVGHVEHGVEG